MPFNDFLHIAANLTPETVEQARTRLAGDTITKLDKEPGNALLDLVEARLAAGDQVTACAVFSLFCALASSAPTTAIIMLGLVPEFLSEMISMAQAADPAAGVGADHMITRVSTMWRTALHPVLGAITADIATDEAEFNHVLQAAKES